MRMWMVNPKIMCRKHLLGEHVEHHMFVGTINKGIALDGYLKNNLLEMESLHSRHLELATEMESRGYNHKSLLPSVSYTGPLDAIEQKVDRESALKELLRRCPDCRARYEEINGPTLPK